MNISFSNAGRRYNREWIFRHFSYTFSSGTAYAITGANGSGKSTLLQCMATSLDLSEGNAVYEHSGNAVPLDKAYRYLSLCAPYLEVVEEFTLREFLDFHQQFKPLLPEQDTASVMAAIGLEAAAGKVIKAFSSGMKQRVKLAQAIFSDVPVVLLDEPCTNLDAAGIALYHSLIDTFCKDRLVVVSSNDAVEYSFCREVIRMGEWKGVGI